MKDPTTSSDRWRLLDHTADIRLEVEGSSLEELFVNAAQGLMALISEPADPDADAEVELRLEAETTEELLVDWLRELLFLHEARSMVLVRAEMIGHTPKMLDALLFCRGKADGEIPPFEVKAVTYHDLKVEWTQNRWTARIVFDI